MPGKVGMATNGSGMSGGGSGGGRGKGAELAYGRRALCCVLCVDKGSIPEISVSGLAKGSMIDSMFGSTNGSVIVLVRRSICGSVLGFAICSVIGAAEIGSVNVWVCRSVHGSVFDSAIALAIGSVIGSMVGSMIDLASCSEDGSIIGSVTGTENVR